MYFLNGQFPALTSDFCCSLVLSVQGLHQAGGIGTHNPLTEQKVCLNQPGRRDKEIAHWKSWLIPSWGSFLWKESKLDSQHETHHILCVFGDRKPAYSLLSKHSWKKLFATEIFLLSFKCKWLWLLYATYANSVLPVHCWMPVTTQKWQATLISKEWKVNKEVQSLQSS